MFRLIIPVLAALLFVAYCAGQQAEGFVKDHKADQLEQIDQLTGANDGQK